MDTPAFQHLLSLFPHLTLRQRRVAQQELTAPPHHYLAQYLVTGMQWWICPHCQADVTELAPWGWSRGLRRYRCKLCLRTSTILTKMPLARLRKAQCWEGPHRRVGCSQGRGQQKHRVPLASPFLVRDGNPHKY